MLKRMISLTLLVLFFALSACAPKRSQSAPSNLKASTAEAVEGEQLVPDVATTLPEPASSSAGGAGGSSSASEITFADSGKSFTYQVGDTFLLNLDSGVYEWTVTVENPQVAAPSGAANSYKALQAGTTVLSAVGEPLCLKSSPPCGMPTVLFKVTLVVK